MRLAATVVAALRANDRPGAPNAFDRAQCLPRLVRATIDGSYAGTKPARLALVAAAAAYVVSPVDLVPDAVLPVIGLADDIVVATWAVRTLVEEADRFLSWEAGQGGPYAGPGLGATGPPFESVTGYVLETVRRRLER